MQFLLFLTFSFFSLLSYVSAEVVSDSESIVVHSPSVSTHTTTTTTHSHESTTESHHAALITSSSNHHPIFTSPSSSLAFGPATHHPAPLRSFHPYPSNPTSNPHPPFQRGNRQSPGAIFGEVVGGLAGVILVLSVVRCIFSWRRTPARDRIAARISRHHLDREMAEAAAQDRLTRLHFEAPSHPPPPPYNHIRLPDYDTAVASGETNV
ncbi:hypothetical protein JAAARDRAFT_224003 [Jaapia argillacea MUCL 33604]|uniref:Transmembrane protein n=1 Tax=Jaapia argillacea MUCL 33604 TaxID=933084 RepID=A0A067QBC5_9AGAM|nr:hypothetical protein JAAARDRAFT_224003 [Jaapia argillacea MUCL 33604]